MRLVFLALVVAGTAEIASAGGLATTTSTTSISTTTSSLATTTTTVPGCLGGATFPGVECSLDGLATATDAAQGELGNLTAKLQNTVAKAQARQQGAYDQCHSGHRKQAQSQLKKVLRRLIQYSHKLRTRSAQKKIPEAVREPLAQTADAIQQDASDLRDALGTEPGSCGGDPGNQ
jgi:hypothetical protein